MLIILTLVMLLFSDKAIAASYQMPNIGSAKVHVVGDSHAQFSFGPIGTCVIHWRESTTMHRVGRDGLKFLNILDFGVQENDTVIFSYGEIDVRCHIAKQKALGRKVEEVIDTLVSKYIATIEANRKLFSKLHCVVFAVIPPTQRDGNPYFPLTGSLEDRVRFTLALNKKLSQEAERHGIAVIDVYKDYATPEGSIIPELTDAYGVHIGPQYTVPVEAKLAALLKTFYRL